MVSRHGQVGLAGSIRDYTLTTHWDATLRLDQLDYNSQPAGYVSSPAEVVNYVENHDNQTCSTSSAYKLPTATSKEDRARVQMLGAAINAFSQGIAYYHAGIDTLRSKSMDRNSYNSGDWFNRLDWSYADNNFGDRRAAAGGQRRQLGAHQAAAGECGDQAGRRRDRLDARRLPRPAGDPRQLDAVPAAHRRGHEARLAFRNTGSAQVPTVLAGHLDGNGYPGRQFPRSACTSSASTKQPPRALVLDADKGQRRRLPSAWPVPTAARPTTRVTEPASGRFVMIRWSTCSTEPMP